MKSQITGLLHPLHSGDGIVGSVQPYTNIYRQITSLQYITVTKFVSCKTGAIFFAFFWPAQHALIVRAFPRRACFALLVRFLLARKMWENSASSQATTFGTRFDNSSIFNLYPQMSDD